MNHVYFTAVRDGAGLAAELAAGDGDPHVYKVEPTGAFEDDPNVTDKKFPGNPTRSYRSDAPLIVIGEVTNWTRLSPEALGNGENDWRRSTRTNEARSSTDHARHDSRKVVPGYSCASHECSTLMWSSEAQAHRSRTGLARRA
jgi:Rifampin ADP-ribosyl transferase